METNRLRQFCVIAETGSLTKASEILHITHSGLSKSMKLLQEELACHLFRPCGRGLALTEDGFKMYQKAKEFLQQEERIFRIEKTLPQSNLRIAALEIFHLGLMGQLKNSPLMDYSLFFFDLDPGRIEHAIAQKKIDFGITCVPCPMEKIEVLEIGEFPLGCYHRQGSFEDIPLSDIPFVVPARELSSNPFGLIERDAWRENHFPRQKKFTADLLFSALELTLQGLCAIYIPKFLVKQVNATRRPKERLVEYPLPMQNKLRVFLLWHKDNYNEELVKILKKMVIKFIK